MRVLFVPLAAPAHLALMVPTAWALRTAGHDVRFAVPPNHVASVLEAGLIAVPFGTEVDLGDSDEAHEGDDGGWDLSELAGLDAPDTARGLRVREYAMGAVAAYCGLELLRPTLDELVALTRDWGPELVVWDHLAFHGSVAARAAGAASARSMIGVDHVRTMRTEYLRRVGTAAGAGSGGGPDDAVAGLLAETLERYGAPGYDERMLFGDWSLNPVPEVVPAPPGLTVVPFRQLPFAPPTPAPEWLAKAPGRDGGRICLTLGRSVRDVRKNDNYGISVSDLFEGLAGLDVEVVATLTRDQLPVGGTVAVPDNVLLTDYVPFDALLPTCSAVIHHGGLGTLMAAAAAAVPQIVVPSDGWDEAELGAAVADRGAGLRLGGAAELTPGELRAATLRVLDDPAFARGAAGLRDAMLGQPAPNDIVPVLERLTEAHRSRR